MKLSVTACELAASIKFASIGAGKNSATDRPLLEFVVGVDMMNVIGHNGEVWASRQCDCLCDEPRTFALDSASTSLLSEISNGDVELSVGESKVVAKWHGGKVSQAVVAAELPQMPTVELPDPMTIGLVEFQECLDLVDKARCKRAGGIRWECVFVESIEPDSLAVFATDSRRMHAVVLSSVESYGRLILPPHLLKGIRGMGRTDGDTIKLTGNASFIQASSTEGHRVMAATPAHAWPNGWEKIAFNDTPTENVAAPASVLIDSLERICRTNDDQVRCDMEGGDGGTLYFRAVSENPPRAVQESFFCDCPVFAPRKLNGGNILNAVRAASELSEEITLRYAPEKRGFTYVGPVYSKDKGMKFQAAVAGFVN